MESIKNYQTVCAIDVAEFDAAVNRRIALGWQPHGGPYAVADTICQAMVKFVKVDEKEMRDYSDETDSPIPPGNRFPLLDPAQLRIKRR